MQATVHAFDEVSGTGAMITDTGLVVPFDLATFMRSGLRRLRVGQRLSVLLDDATRPGAVVEMWLGSTARLPGDSGPAALSAQTRS